MSRSSRKHGVRLGTSLRVERLEDRQMLSGIGLSSLLGNALSALQSLTTQGAQVANQFLNQVATGIPTAGKPAATRALDRYEPDDTSALATTIPTTGALQTHTLDVSADVDWVKFTLTQTTDVVIETRGTVGDTRMSLYGQDAVNPLQFDDNSGVGKFSRILRAGTDTSGGHHPALAAGTYYVKVDAAPHLTAITYTIGVTSVQPGDMFLVQSTTNPTDILISTPIRVGEAAQLKVPYSSTYYHAALYLGNDRVAEMLGTGFTDRSTLETLYAHNTWIDVYRRSGIGSDGQAVVDAVEKYVGTPYAYTELGVFGLAYLMPNSPSLIKSSFIYTAYKRSDYGTKAMICSELVARAFAEAQTADHRSLAVSVTPWPAIAKLASATGDTSTDFAMDFTSPTMLSLSPSLVKLDA